MESAAEVAVLIAVIEQAIVTIAAGGNALALIHLKEIATALEGFHVKACRIYCTPLHVKENLHPQNSKINSKTTNQKPKSTSLRSSLKP